ncbi:divergent polysaccharide deacetylase family protein [Solidesulfovibrio sp.]|uniref:divergent polysaccharide deacetylase family protein n=1 Tax=Solidesulfovibrio sp. TaxID=2910990 RepID=UPI003A5216BD
MVVPGRPSVAVLAGLALAVSLAVLAVVLFRPFPPLPGGKASSPAKAGEVRRPASGAAKADAAAPRPQPPAAGASKQADLPFEEHLAGRESAPPPSTPASEMRALVQPSVTIPGANGEGAADPRLSGPVDPVPNDVGKGPRMVVVIDDIGDNPAMATNLMELPIPVTLAILPHRPRTRAVAAQAAARGIEVILHQPMQPGSYPRVNPGPGAVFTDMDAARIQAALSENLDELPQAIGINNHMGSEFTSNAAGMAAVMPVLKARGLFFMDSVTSAVSAAPEAARAAGVPFYRRAVFLDNVRNTRTILGQLKTADRHAIQHGRAIAIGHPDTETLEALKLWAKERDPRINLVTLRGLGPEF